MDIVTAIITSGLTVVGMLGGLFFVFFKILKGTITDIRSDNIRLEARLSSEISKLDMKLHGEIKATKDELKEDIQKVDSRIDKLDEKVTVLDKRLTASISDLDKRLSERLGNIEGQITQMTRPQVIQMPIDRPPPDDLKEN